METCETCRWAHINWRKGETYMRNDGYGYSAAVEAVRPTTSVQCRRHAPRKAAQEGDSDGWPWIAGDDYCGEYSPTPTQSKE